MGQAISKRYFIQKRWRDKNTEFLKQKNRKWYLAHREEILKEYRRLHPEVKRKKYSLPLPHKPRLRKLPSTGKLFGKELDRANAALKNFNGVCFICETKNPGRKKWQRDHDHKTGKFRGIICGSCNSGLAFFRDDVFALIRATSYLLERT